MQIENPKKDCYVYRHIRPDKNEPFYIGIGSNKRRSNDKYGRNKHWTNIVNLCGGNYDIEILVDGLTWEQACIKEIEFIALYGRRDLGTGTLVNLTDGGEGARGNKGSKRHSEVMMQRRGEKHPMFGKTHSEEARRKISEALRLRPYNPETFKKIAEKLRGRKKKITDKVLAHNKKIREQGNAWSKKVINTETNEVFISIYKAAESIGILPSTLGRYLSGIRKNITPFKYYTDENI